MVMVAAPTGIVGCVKRTNRHLEDGIGAFPAPYRETRGARRALRTSHRVSIPGSAGLTSLLDRGGLGELLGLLDDFGRGGRGLGEVQFGDGGTGGRGLGTGRGSVPLLSH